LAYGARGLQEFDLQTTCLSAAFKNEIPEGKRMTLRHAVTVLLLTFGLGEVSAQVSDDFLQLPAPDTSGGKPLMQVLKERKSSRSFSEQRLSDQELSNLLWAAFGINRPDGRRTAPSARNWQEIDIYCFTADGVFLYDAKKHGLVLLIRDDLRQKTGSQDFVTAAPLNLVYIADMSRVKDRSGDDAMLFVGADCGFIAQNVYLYCASQGLATVVRGMVDREQLAKALGLRADQRILLAQTIGRPAP
jgi:SagB-type dehydrogenase family enzyme